MRFFLLIKIIFSLLLFTFVVLKLDRHVISHIFNTTNGIKALVLGVSMLLLQVLISGFRLSMVLKLYDIQLDFLTSIRSCFVGNFFSQTMISFLGGDAVRIWYLKRRSIITKTVVSAIFLDRVIGFIALIFLFLLLFPSLMSINMLSSMRYGVMLLLAGSVSAVAIFFLLALLSRWPKELIFQKTLDIFIELCSSARHLFFSFRNSAVIFLLSLGIQLLNIIIIYHIFQCYNVELSFYWCSVLAVPALLISMLPISIAGWGVRETAMVMGFSLVGIPADKILSVSIIFGLALFFAGLPGLFIFLFERKQPRAHVSEP